MDEGELTGGERERYRRQMLIEGFGEGAQMRLRRATVGVLGVGGLGSPASMYLAAAGVGQLVLVDDQRVELSNLNRQLLHWDRDASASRQKTESGAEKLRALNQQVRLQLRAERVDGRNISLLLGEADVVLDCTDNFATRMELNAFCASTGKPFVHAGVEGMAGQITTIVPGETPCLRCIFPRTPARKGPIPILGATAGVFGAMQALEAIKLITGVGRPLKGRMLVADLAQNAWDIIEVDRDPECPVCCR